MTLGKTGNLAQCRSTNFKSKDRNCNFIQIFDNEESSFKTFGAKAEQIILFCILGESFRGGGVGGSLTLLQDLCSTGKK